MVLARTFLVLGGLAAILGAGCDSVSCKTVDSPASSACVPDAIDVDRDVRIELRELCGLNCSRQPVCTATLVAGVIIIEAHADQCTDVLPNACSAEACQQRIYGCKLPPLPAGDYTLRGSGLPDQILRVRPGGAAACNLANRDGGV